MQQATRISDETVFFLLGELIEANDTETLFSFPREQKLKIILPGGLDNAQIF